MLTETLDTVADDAKARWDVPRRLAILAFVAPVMGAVLVIGSRLHGGTFAFLTAEDSLLEWAQFVGFLVAAVFGALVAIRHRHAGNLWVAGAFAAFAAGCLFIAGEEIAWGQRLLGIETPESFAEMNEQGETTIHNINGVLILFNVGMLVVGLVGAAMPWVLRRSAAGSRAPWRYLVPPLFLTSAFSVMFLYKLVRFTVLPQSRYTITKFGEWAELCLALALGAFAWLQWRRCAEGSSGHDVDVASNPRTVSGESRGTG